MELVYALLIVLIFVSVIIIVYISYYNRLQECKIRIDEAEGIIDENLRKKYDLLIKLRGIILNHIGNKKSLFKELDDIKNENISNFDLDRKLNSFDEIIVKVMNDYESIQEEEDFINCQKDIKDADERISAAKGYYNNNITLLNELVRKMPSNIIAKMHNIKVKNFFDNKDLNDDIINDFKF